MPLIDDIAAKLQGYDPQALSVAQVGAFLAALVAEVGPLSADRGESTQLPVADALGAVLAADHVSPVNVPPHDNSAMDGYAFAGAALTPGQALHLKVAGTAMAGLAWAGVCGAGQCVRIMTGAIMPTGLDTVVPQELCTLDGNAIAIAPGTLRTGDNRRFAGEDIAQGSVALTNGTRLMPAALGLLASLGVPAVQVLRPLRVAYFSTGNEVLSLGDAPREGAIFDSNRYTVRGLLTRLGCEVIVMGVVGDDPTALRLAFSQAAACADAVITSGGVSVGEADFTKTMMRELGEVAFWKVAMRPGRPMAVGAIAKKQIQVENQEFDEKSLARLNDSSLVCYQNSTDSKRSAALLFGLPGNPVAVMVTFLAFVRPALLQLMGATEAAPPMLKAQSLEAIRKKPGRTEYQRGVVSASPTGNLQVQTTGNQGSGVLSSMVQANGLIVLPHEGGNVQVGDWVDVMVFEGVV